MQDEYVIVKDDRFVARQNASMTAPFLQVPKTAN